MVQIFHLTFTSFLFRLPLGISFLSSSFPQHPSVSLITSPALLNSSPFSSSLPQQWQTSWSTLPVLIKAGIQTCWQRDFGILDRPSLFTYMPRSKTRAIHSLWLFQWIFFVIRINYNILENYKYVCIWGGPLPLNMVPKRCIWWHL